LRLYLDACCLNRLTDDQSQVRIRQEAEAVEGILRLVRGGKATWVSSSVIDIEVGRNPDENRRHDVTALLAFADEVVTASVATAERAAHLAELGFGAFDALHLACAELGGVDVFLTTDDDLLRRAGRVRSEIRVRVENPVSWYEETAR
jgi:predicted nucleic acid-binding protein